MGARASCVDRVSAPNGLRRVVARASVLSPAAAVSVSVRSIPDRVQGQPGVRSFFADKTLPLLSIHRCHVVPAGPRPDLFMGWRCSSRRPNYIKGNTPRAHVHNGIALFLAPTVRWVHAVTVLSVVHSVPDVRAVVRRSPSAPPGPYVIAAVWSAPGQSSRPE